MPENLLIARNPEEGTRLPYLLRIPLGPGRIVLKARETWPRTAKVYCQPAEIRTWARTHGFEAADRGRIPAEVAAAFDRRHG